MPFSNDFGKVMEKLRNVIIKYDSPDEPVATEDWAHLYIVYQCLGNCHACYIKESVF